MVGEVLPKPVAPRQVSQPPHLVQAVEEHYAGPAPLDRLEAPGALV